MRVNIQTPPLETKNKFPRHSISMNSAKIDVPKKDEVPAPNPKEEAPSQDILLSSTQSPESKKNKEKNISMDVYSPQKVKGLKKPGIFFISGFDYFGLASKQSDGLSQLAEAIPGAQSFQWNEKDKILAEIKKRSLDQPIILVGHSLGGDTAVELGQILNSPKHHFRNVNLLITLDSFGLNNDIIPPNVSQNINFLGEKNFFLNDSPNVARNFDKTDVINELRSETHSQLDNSEEIQNKIMSSIFQIIGPDEHLHPTSIEE